MLYGLFTEYVTERSKPTFVGTLALRYVISFSSTIGVTYHTTGRILSKVYKPILFYNPCTATDSLSVTIKHCSAWKTVHKCATDLENQLRSSYIKHPFSEEHSVCIANSAQRFFPPCGVYFLSSLKSLIKSSRCIAPGCFPCESEWNPSV